MSQTNEDFLGGGEKAGLSLREMARRLKFSAPFVSHLERGRRNWTEKLAERFTDVLCPPND